ncbi:MAG: 4Fe-4S binding protein [Bryobacteraceae bacterium]
MELGHAAAPRLSCSRAPALRSEQTRCIRCGLCAERCPVSVITMEASPRRRRLPRRPVRSVRWPPVGSRRIGQQAGSGSECSSHLP